MTSATSAAMMNMAPATAMFKRAAARQYGANDGNDVDDADVHVPMRQVITMMVTRLMRKSARAEDQEICQTDHARGAVHACGPCGMFVAMESCPGRMTRVSRVHRVVR